MIDPGSPFPSEESMHRQQDVLKETLNLEQLERNAIRRALEQCNGNMSMAAELLGITRYALYRKIDKHGI